MKARLAVVLVVPLVAVTILYLTHPVTALTDGYMRKSLENNAFSERMIKAALYAKSSHDVYQRERREYVHGLSKVNKEYVYEPDVLTWNLAMNARRAQIGAMNPPPPFAPGMVQPASMEPNAMQPGSPDQVMLTPLESGQPSRQLTTDAEGKMQAMLERAREQGLRPDGQLQGASIKQRLLDHMNSLNGGYTGYQPPNPPVLAPLPPGKRGDSYDQEY